MAKAKIKFNLNNPVDAEDFERYIRSYDLASVIWEFATNSRKTIQQKIANAEGEITASEAIDMCFERFSELLNK